MKTYRFYIMTLALTFLFAGCSEDELTKGSGAKVGDDVQFGLSLSNLDTRTVYGDETSTGFPIYWVNGDKVRVASPQCLSGRNTAEYQIAVTNPNQNFATSMTKTGDYGVQWGDAATADFYSIYPSSASTKLEVNGEGVTTTLHVDPTQFASTTDNGTSYYAQPAEMGNVVMYAVTKGVSNTAEAVELRYKPFSTVIEFEITAPDTYTGSQKSEITIQSLSLIAPTNTTIAGDFTFNFPSGENSSPSAEAASGGSDQITLHFLDNNQYTTKLSTTKQTLKAKMCLMPISGVNNLAGWTVELNTSAGTFKKTLTDQTGELKAGLVHKIKLPKLNYASEEWIYSLDSWIPTLPDYTNIYLSELSLPGAWYAGSSEAYQATSDIATLWNAGVRAFAVETRTTSTKVGTSIFGATIYEGQDEPNGLILSGTGNNSTNSFASGTNTLNTTATSSSKAYLECSDRYTPSGYKLSSIIDDIAKCVKDDEFGVLVISYADGGAGGHRYIDHGAWLHMIYEAYNNCTQKNKIYQNAITANTTVNDVLGKLILKINVDADIAMGGTVNSTSYTYIDKSLPALFSYNPFPLQITANSNSDLNGLSVPYFSNLSWSAWGDDTSMYRTYFRASAAQTRETPFLWCFSSANRTDCTDTSSEDGSVTNSEVATLSQRKAALKAMGNYSKQIYDASTHNVWFYYNCGGTHATVKEGGSPSPTTFATNMNQWLLNRIKIKCGEVANDDGEKKAEPSPLGIVMFNQCTAENNQYYGTDIIKYIIEMNSKFYLKHAGTSGGSTGGDATPTSEVKTAAPGYDSGMVNSKTDAISPETGN